MSEMRQIGYRGLPQKIFFEYSPSRTSKNAVLWKLKPSNLSFAS